GTQSNKQAPDLEWQHARHKRELHWITGFFWFKLHLLTDGVKGGKG
ncbi:7904_t:CDS:1, partial [Scutellospora calospora]